MRQRAKHEGEGYASERRLHVRQSMRERAKHKRELSMRESYA